jgi:hypothetical protein
MGKEMNPEKLKEMFSEQVRWIIKEQRVRKWTTGVRLEQMIRNHGGAYQAAKKLLDPKCEPCAMFTTARNNGWQHLTLESLVLDSRYRSLFTDVDREIARYRLDHAD